jgi:cytochrome c peroxidase
MRFALGAVVLLSAASLAACTAETGEDLGSTQSAVDFSTRFPKGIPASDISNMPGDLRAVSVPGIKDADLAPYVKDRKAAIRLGKALFWDMQVGSDGKTACASCHFRAGADPRTKNQMSNGPANLGPGPKGTNYQLTSNDFPLTKLPYGVRVNTDSELNPNPGVVSSQGVHHLTAGEMDPNGFLLGTDGPNTRRVEPRNTPSVINAVFNHRQFWDGRADNTFNGVNHAGPRDTTKPFVLRANDPDSNPAVHYVSIPNASLASQAVAPLLSTFEMAHPGRNMLDVSAALAKHARGQGKRIVNGNTRPLSQQVVSREDSVLGDIALAPARGLNVSSYDKMIADAFHTQWWDSKLVIRMADAGGEPQFKSPGNPADGYTDYTLAQYNWALIFGLSVQLYEETLVSDETPWDKFRRVNSGSNLNPQVNTNPAFISHEALWGATLFNDRTRGPVNIRCSNCHEQNEMTDASTRRVNAATNKTVRNRDGNVIDKGFNNIGIRPTSEDLGVGGSDAFGLIAQSYMKFPQGTIFPPSTCIPSTPGGSCLSAPPTVVFDGADVSKGFGVEGAFKTPSLRNVALTAPYFHNGEASTLRQVVEFYSRGGNVLSRQTDGTLIEPLGVPGLSSAEIDAIVAFLNTLTDDRVVHRKAPFDHPQLFVPNGHSGVDADGDGLADDIMVEIDAVGANGGAPIPGFLEAGPFAAN